MNNVLAFWFPNNNYQKWWFKSDNNLDQTIYNTFYNDIVVNLDVPDEGYIVVMGTARAVSFDILCKHFGEDRCIGFDLYNPSEHPRVKIKDCMELSDIDNEGLIKIVGALQKWVDMSISANVYYNYCLLYTSDAADE